MKRTSPEKSEDSPLENSVANRMDTDDDRDANTERSSILCRSVFLRSYALIGQPLVRLCRAVRRS